ncbi:MAG: ABC transporter permease [Luteimonas sp.]|nr:ABC transporter permease [Luteimonas sp.]
MSVPGTHARDPKGSFWRDLGQSLRNPEFWALSSWLAILVRSRRSRLGIIWLMAPSAFYVFGLGSFFASMRGVPMALFAAHVALGAMVFRTLMSSVVASAGIFNANYSFIMDGRVRMTDYLLQSLAKAFFDMCAYLPVVVVTLVMFGAVSFLGLLSAPLVLLLIYANALWVGTVFSMIGARYPDFGQLIANASIFVFLLTPIIWFPEDMPADSIRGQLMRLNPFFHFVCLFRNPIMGIPVEPMSYWVVGG